MVRGRVFFFFFLIQSVAVAQKDGDLPAMLHNDRYIITRYNSENGLPQNSAKDLLLDRNNFLWIATENGLVRFDGQRFRVYNTSNTPFLQTNRFAIISETPQRDVLFTSGFDASLIYKAMPDYRLMIDSPASRLPHKLICYHSNGIFDAAPMFARYARHGSPLDPSPGSPPGDTTLLNALLHASSFWVLDKKEAVVRYVDDWYYLNNASGEVIKLPVAPEHKETQQAFFCHNIFGILREKGKILFFRNGRPAAITVDRTVTALLQSALATPSPGILFYTKGSLVIAKVANSIYTLHIDRDTMKATLLFQDLPFLENQPSYSFQYDSISERLFVGTQNEGLFVVTKRKFHTLAFGTNDFTSNVFMAFLLLPGEKILTSNGILDRTGGSTLFTEEERIDRHAMFRSSNGRIWLTRNKRLLSYDSSFSGKIVEDSLPLDSYTTSFLEGTDHALWISTVSSILRRENGKLTVVLDRYPPFVKNNIETMAEVFPGILWIATRNGIYAYHMADNKLEEQPLFPHIYARNIFRARDGSIWVGTYGNGYFKYLHGDLISLPLDPQKYLAATHTFAEDDMGFFWIPTNHGLFRIKKSDLDSFAIDNKKNIYFDYFERSAGFNTNEFNGGCSPVSLKDPQGNFYFPSLNGMVWFNPDSIGSELPDRNLFIDNFSVDSASLDHTQALRIKPDFLRIVVDLSTPFYGLAENLRLEYKIDPVGEKWYPVEAGGKIIINRLPYGKYILRVRKMNGWKEENFAYVSIPFEVLPQWYNTWLFYGLLAVLLICMVLLVLRLRTRFLLRQNIRLQRKVEERTEELEQSTALKEKLLSVIVHDLRSPLFSQSLLIGFLAENHPRMDPAELGEILEQLEESSKGICQFSTDFLTWYNSQMHGFTIRKEPIELAGFARATGAFYKNMADRKGLPLHYDISPGLLLFSDRNILAVVIRNIMDNAIKYTKSGSIRIRAEEDDGAIRIQVRDTGAGMSAARIREILSYTEKETGKVTSTFGYRFITELTRKLGGHLHIESDPGKGTVVTVTLRSRESLILPSA